MTLDQLHLSNAQNNGKKMLRLKRSLHSLAEIHAQLTCPLAPSGAESEDVRWSCTGTMMQNVQDMIIAQADALRPR